MIPVIALWKLILPGLIAGVGALYRIARHPQVGLRPSLNHHPWLASSLEEKAYHALTRLYPQDRYLISAHMGLIDVIGRNYLDTLSREDRRFAWHAHCDFVIVDRRTLAIQKVIEVNGRQHLRPDQALRDRQKSKILAVRGIALDIW